MLSPVSGAAIQTGSVRGDHSSGAEPDGGEQRRARRAIATAAETDVEGEHEHDA